MDMEADVEVEVDGLVGAEAEYERCSLPADALSVCLSVCWTLIWLGWGDELGCV